jgi:hypothetical protein
MGGRRPHKQLRFDVFDIPPRRSALTKLEPSITTVPGVPQRGIAPSPVLAQQPEFRRLSPRVKSCLLSYIIDAEEESLQLSITPERVHQTRLERRKDMAFIQIRGMLVDV